MSDQENMADEIDQVIGELSDQGVTQYPFEDRTGMGDVIESALTKFGITEERFKEWFNLDECNCSERKAWLNSVFSWHKWNKQKSKGN